ncbi:saccharopine dehydrogenase (NAD+, L-lysine-forming) [Rhizomicrobium palustre]|uniref:Saccharopine dehydrogenase (NAD+, L-lysine-forming) n=1 Tax=Rhizomicrobium palustre TaxID=189966 RepID=A0A846MUI5_9PROT|nr:saccharopine dehydrogenase NADP-binding domain-containing protein [Rhizomicrobium palustre]NIK87006.1 saccharopine dehydrogenase (NAD+, L-lysine-forming) [Rhizomicrobium palustre]
MAAKILILGGTGMTGRLIVRHLLERSDAIITIASRRLEKAQELAADLGRDQPERLLAVRAVAGDAESLKAAMPGHQIVVVASPTTQYTEMVARHALLFGLDYLDIQLGAQKLATLRTLEYEIAKAGRCFITEAGFHPGLPSLLVRYAAEQFDRIETAITACYLSIDKDIPYTDSVDELVEVFRNYQPQIYTHKHWTIPGVFNMKKIAFGGDIGTRDSYSMFFEELHPLPEMYPSLKETGFFMAGGHWFTDWVVYPTAIAALKMAPAARRPIGRYLWWGMRRFQKAPYRTELIVQASGLHAGQPTHFEAAVSHRDAYELTAIPVTAMLLQYLEGMGRRAGLWMMGHIAEPRRLLTDMKRMGVKVRSTTH